MVLLVVELIWSLLQVLLSLLLLLLYQYASFGMWQQAIVMTPFFPLRIL